MSTKNYLAVDLGATSGRTIVASYDGKKVDMRELTRFKNPMIPLGGHLFWDLPALYNEILEALKKTVEDNIKIESIGIDTWGCDFAFFGKDRQLLSLPYCYRDPHTDGSIERYMKMHDKREIYDRTGIQFMEFNSLFQLDTLRHNGCTALQDADKILFIPDALIYMLTGKAICEYTVASTSQLLNPVTRDLDKELLMSIGLSREQFGPMTQPGTVIGSVTKQIQEITGIGDDVKVVAIAAHDTASAVAAVPAKDAEYAYLSCGTWSLMGIESPNPIITDESYKQNFTNEGGIDGTTRFLKNICGMWIYERCRKEWADAPKSHSELQAEAMKQPAFVSLINPDDAAFANPSSMTEAIRSYCKRTSQPVPEGYAAQCRCI